MFVVPESQRFQQRFSLEDIGSIFPRSTSCGKLIDAIMPSGKAQDLSLDIRNRCRLSGPDALMLMTLFHTNRLVPWSYFGRDILESRALCIKSIFGHSKIVGASSLFKFLQTSSHPTIDALSEVLFKEALLSENIDVARLLLGASATGPSMIDPNALLPGPWPSRKLGTRRAEHPPIGPQRPIEVAIWIQNAKMVQLLLDHHARADNLLAVAREYGTAEILEAVVNSDYVNVASRLIGLVQLQNVPAVEHLLEHGADANTCDPESGSTALICAITVGNYDLTELLLNKGADANLPIKDVAESSPEATKQLTNEIPDVSIPTQGGMTPLHVAALHNHLSIAELLLRNLAQIDDPYSHSTDEARMPTALQTAVSCGHSEMASLLLRWGADANAPAPNVRVGGIYWENMDLVRNTNDLTTLMIAFRSHNAKMIRLLLDNGLSVGYAPVEARFSVDYWSYHGSSALAESLQLGAPDITQSVLNLGAPLFPDALCAAAEKGDFKMMQYLLDKGVDINHLHWNTTPLTAAIQTNNFVMSVNDTTFDIEDVCTFLLERGADINREGAYPTALQAAARSDYLDLAKFLIDQGADIHDKAVGYEILHKAISTDDLELVQFLVKQGVDVNYKGQFGMLLAQAIEEHNFDVVRCLVEGGADVNYHDNDDEIDPVDWEWWCYTIDPPRIPDPRTTDPLELAIRYLDSPKLATRKFSMDIVRLLIKYGAKCDRNAVLSCAARHCDRALFEQIIVAVRLSSPDFDTRMRESCLGHGALFDAIGKRKDDIFEILLGFNIDLSSPCMYAAMWLSCQRKDISLMRRLRSAGSPVDISKEASPCTRRRYYGRYTPLYRAASYGPKEAVQFLLGEGADPNCFGEDGYPILCEVSRGMQLGFLSQQDHLEILESLIKAGTDINRSSSGIRGRTALQKATEDGNGEMVDRLIDAGADIHAPPAKKRGVTALQAAAIGGYLGIAEKLLKLGAYVDAQGAEEQGKTALEGAAEHGRLNMVQLLLNAGAGTSPSTGKQQHENAIKLAKQEGHNSVAKLLERHQAINGF